MEEILLDKRFDEWISDALMYELPTTNGIVESGKIAEARIYNSLKYIESVKKIKL
jgi:hypothetical protein